MKSSPSAVRCALVGHGYWGANLMRCFSQTKGCEVLAVCEPETKRHEEISLRYPHVRYFDTDFATTLRRPDVDAVILATPANAHYEQARDALIAGKHVFVEKPLSNTSQQARELLELAEAKNLKLVVGHTFLYNDAVNWVRDAIERGDMGDIYYVYLQRLALGKVRDDVDALWNLAPHDISIVMHWFQEYPLEVTATGMSFLQPGIDDVSFLTMRFPSGKLAHVHVSWLDPSKTRKGVIVGSKKMVIYDDTSLDQKITVCDKGVDRKSMADTFASRPFRTYEQFSLIQRAGDIVIPKISFREPLQVEAAHFVSCIQSGEQPLTDGKSGLAVVAVLEAASESRRIGKTVRVADLERTASATPWTTATDAKPVVLS